MNKGGLVTVPWDSTFEARLRSRLPYLPEGALLAVDTVLATFGLDSLGMVAFVADVEATYGIRLPDEALVPLNFHTPGSAWAMLSGVLADQYRAEAGS